MIEITLFPATRVAGIYSLGLVACLLAGCGGGDEFSTASVAGTVTMNGQPVNGGSITFVPIADGEGNLAGKPASGPVQEDGAFTLSTYQENDGAVIGKHRVMYSPPQPISTETPEGGHAAPPQPSKYAGMVPITPEVEVTSGENDFEIEIARRSS